MPLWCSTSERCGKYLSLPGCTYVPTSSQTNVCPIKNRAHQEKEQAWASRFWAVMTAGPSIAAHLTCTLKKSARKTFLTASCSTGQFLAARRMEFTGVIDVATAEAQALRDGLRLAESLGCNRLYIETDSLETVHALADPGNHRTVGMTFLDECRLIMAGFDSTCITHCPREANKAAHMIARCVDDTNVWIEEPPVFLYPQLVDDWWMM